MSLANLIAHHKQELICDLAEYYSIYDYREVPVFLLGTLVAGLRDESRIGMIRNNVKGSPVTVMLASIYDELMALFCGKENKPAPLIDQFIITKHEEDNKPQCFRTGDEMMRYWNKLREQCNE